MSSTVTAWVLMATFGAAHAPTLEPVPATQVLLVIPGIASEAACLKLANNMQIVVKCWPYQVAVTTVVVKGAAPAARRMTQAPAAVAQRAPPVPERAANAVAQQPRPSLWREALAAAARLIPQPLVN